MTTPEDASEEVAALVSEYLAAEYPVSQLRSDMASARGYDPGIWRRMAKEIGLSGVGISEEFGGSGMDIRAIGATARVLGESLTCVPFLTTAGLAARALAFSQDEHIAERYLPEISAGTCIATVAISSHTPFSPDVPAIITATPSREGWLLAGAVQHVLDLRAAQLLLVFASMDQDDLGLFAVITDSPGLEVTPAPLADLTRRAAHARLADTPAMLVARGAAARRAAQDLVCAAALLVAADQLGGSIRCLEMAVDYATTRYQFGRAIGSFQAIKHRCSEMLVQVELERTAVSYALQCADAGPAHAETNESQLAASMAKAFCSDAYVTVAGSNLQIHGGIGFTWEHSAHLYLKRAKTDQMLYGTPIEHRARVGQLADLTPGR